METAGLPFSRLRLSSFAAPSAMRATSRTRSSEPSELARSTIAPNWSGVTRRPWVCTFSWNCVSSDVGRAPMRPTGACTFCAWIAVMMSLGDRFRLTRRLMSNQMRIE